MLEAFHRYRVEEVYGHRRHVLIHENLQVETIHVRWRRTTLATIGSSAAGQGAAVCEAWLHGAFATTPAGGASSISVTTAGDRSTTGSIYLLPTRSAGAMEVDAMLVMDALVRHSVALVSV